MICEFTHRDGTARAGKLIDGEKELLLPGICSREWFPALQNRELQYVPPLADEEFAAKYLTWDGEQPVPLHQHGPFPVTSGTVLIAANWHTLIKQPREFIRQIVSLKERHLPDTAWYLPGAALPENAAILVHAGFDLFDTIAVDLAGARGEFCLSDGTHPAAMMNEQVCSCDGCRSGDLTLHNRIALMQELALVRSRIREGTFREFLEGRCRNRPEYVSIMRNLERTEFMMMHTPVSRNVPLYACSGDSIHRPEVRRFIDRLLTRYLPPKADVAVLLPCSARKPYSVSQSHRRFMQAVGRRAHELIMTSPLGLVPRDIELVYPAAHYDVPVTGYWDHEERHVIRDVLARYFAKHPYRRVIAHLDGDALLIAQEAADEAGIALECTGGDNPAGGESLRQLSEALAGEKKIKSQMVRGMISFQFGYDLRAAGLEVKGIYPDQVVQINRRQVFSTDPAHGLLRPTFEGWSLIENGYRVYIDDFVPKGDILAPGVVEADPAIREGDEVLVIGDHARATGRAMMSAGEMIRSTRGVAVRVRKVMKLNR